MVEPGNGSGLAAALPDSESGAPTAVSETTGQLMVRLHLSSLTRYSHCVACSACLATPQQTDWLILCQQLL
jgi:hypothetical protein